MATTKLPVPAKGESISALGYDKPPSIELQRKLRQWWH